MAQQKPVWHCAVKNTTTSKKHWYYHLFYDFDNMNLESSTVYWIVDFMRKCKMSFVLRRSAHGYHLIGLTPVDSATWGLAFSKLQKTFPTYHDGHAIRITKKEEKEFEIIASDFSFPYVLNLAKLFKLKIEKEQLAIKEQWYVLLYYTTNKDNMRKKEVIGLHKGVNTK